MDRNSPPAPCRPLDELEAEITELAGHLNAAQHRWLTLIAEFDRRKGWSDGACHSCAHWLNFKCGVALGAAREKVRVAHALETLPKIAAAMARGELSYSKVRALTRAADAATEDYFLSIALHGTAHHVERLVQCYRRAQEAEELSREARQHAGRSVSYFFDGDGALVLKARLPAEVGTLLIQALDAAVDAAADAIPGPDVPAGICVPNQFPDPHEDERPSRAARRADAVAVLAESFLKHGPAALGGERHQIVVHVDAETLRHGTAGRCEIEHGPALPAETVRRLGCDCSVVMLLENAQGGAARCRPENAQHPARAASRPQRTGSGVPLPRLHAQPLCARPSRASLGTRWRNEGLEPRHPLQLPPPPGPRGRRGRAGAR